MEITFLGTTCMVPTKERSHPAMFIKYAGDGLLFDCGENTQRQLKQADIRLPEVTHLFISHWHGDHVLGIPGLLQSLGASDYTKTLKIYGPRGTKEHFHHLFKAFVFDRRIDLEIIEYEEGMICETSDYTITAYKLDHSILTYGFRFAEKDRRRINVPYINRLGIPHGPLLGQLQRGKDIEFEGKTISVDEATYLVPGKAIGIIADTQLSPACYTIAQDADLLISEASYTSELTDKAREYKHLTAQEAGQIASHSGAKKLVLTHISARYANPQDIEEDAKTVFSNVSCAYDLQRVTV